MCLLITTSLFAMDIKTGGNIGLNGSANTGSDWQKPIKDSGFSNEVKLGFEMGAFWEIPINDLFSVQPEINFLLVRAGYSGTDHREGFDGYTYTPYTVDIKFSQTLKILEIPVLAKLNFGTKTKFFLLAGPIVEIILGDVTTNWEENENTYSGFFGYTAYDKHDYVSSPDNRFILGGTVGLGFSIPTSEGRFILDLRYRTTFTKIFNNDNTMVNTVGLRIGYGVDIEL